MPNTDTKYISEVSYIQPKIPMRMKTDLPLVLSTLLASHALLKKERLLLVELLEIIEDAKPEIILEEAEICFDCRGSGEGMFDETICLMCGGSGELKVDEVE